MSSRTTSLVVAFSTLLALALPTAPIAAAAASATPRANVAGCGPDLYDGPGTFQLGRRPTHFYPCTGSSPYFRMAWSTWEPTQAIGTATVTENTCKPNCAESTTSISDQAEVTFSKPLPTPNGPVFSIFSWRDIQSKRCDYGAPCVVTYFPLEQNTLALTATLYRKGTSCPPAWAGDAATGYYPTYVLWCEKVGVMWEWVTLSV
jgi:hypothetical protein